MSDESVRKRKKNSRDDETEKEKDKRSKRARSRSKSPIEHRDRDSRGRRKRSRSRSPDRLTKREIESTENEVKKEPPERKNKETDMLNTRTGGAYIPPARLRMMQAQITDKNSVAFQRLAWEALKKSIHGHINKINVGNIGIIIRELLKENIVRGRGLLCRSVIQAQAASPTFTNVYAALVSAVNSRFPNIGELLLKRLVIQFKRGFKRNDKPTCISSALFIAHLVNQRVAHEILALELLTLLVETPTDDSVEVSIAFLKECGQKLTEVSSKGVNAIFEMLRNILHEGQLDKRVQYMIEVMFQVWKDGFKDHPAVIEELELVPEEEQFTHLLMLDDATDAQDILNVFKFDDKYEDNEQTYKALSKEILGSDAESGDEEGSGSGESGSEESDDEDDENGEAKPVTIIDNTETNLVALRRTIYLTINSSLDFEECAHKLMKMQLKPGQEAELCHMFLDCCAEQRTYEKFYGLLAQRFCNLNRIFIDPFEQIFKDSYGTAHRLDTNRLRNVSKFFAHLLFTDSISWEALECVRLTEEDTTSSSRIFIKILFQELAEYMGLKKLNDRLKDPTLQEAFSGIFPRDNPKNTRFSINFFTSIGLGGLTDELREHLKQMPKSAPPPAEIRVGSSSSESSSSDSSSSSSSEDSSSESNEDQRSKKNKSKEKNKNSKKEKPKTPEAEEAPNKNNAERWGHDGFYDTYGKDARRHERNERDDDGFFRPRDPKDIRRNNREVEGRRREDKELRQRESDRYQRERNERESNRRNERSDFGRSEERRRKDRDKRERDEDSGYDSRKEKEKRKKEKHEKEKRDQGRRDRASPSPDKSSSDDDDKTSRNKRRGEKSIDEEWDIRRESSVRRSESRAKEVTRYWDSFESKKKSIADDERSKAKRREGNDGWDIRGSSVRRSESREREERSRYWDSDSSNKQRSEKTERRRERS